MDNRASALQQGAARPLCCDIHSHLTVSTRRLIRKIVWPIACSRGGMVDFGCGYGWGMLRQLAP